MISRELQKTAEEAVALLKEKELKVATAESCTGGLVASLITSVSGVSEIFEMGIVSYSCRIKHEALGVKQETLDKYGAISENTAKEMAVNIKEIAGSDIGLSVTGAAGPDGSEGHPAGYVFIGVAFKESVTVKLLNIEPLGRSYVRERAAEELFKLLETCIKEMKE